MDGTFPAKKSGHLARWVERVQIISKEPNRKSWLRIWLEISSRRVRKDLKKSGYMTLRAYRTDADRLQDYIPETKWLAFLDEICTPGVARILDDKLAFQKHMEDAGFKLPQLYGTFRNGQFEVYSEGQHVHFSSEQASAALSQLRSVSNGAIFAKLISGSCGIGAFRVSDVMSAEELLAALGAGDFLFQADVTQHPEVAAFHPQSLNTLRLSTVLDSSGNAHVYSGFLRIGCGGNEVDNAHAGGYLNVLDTETGALQDMCYRNLEHNTTQTEVHPDSGLSFSGFRIPYFKKAHALVRRAAETALPNPITGWDIAITPDGPILIEANRRPSVMEDQ